MGTPILLVEDNPDDVLFMQRAAKQAQISSSINVASDGQAAINYLSSQGEFGDKTRFPTPCLVLLDLKLPYKSGLEVLYWIRAQATLRALPVIMFTSSAETADVEEAYRIGANAYLVKPANMNDLISILQSLKSFWLEHNLLPAVASGRGSLLLRVQR